MDGNYDFRECVGLKVKPRKGDGLLFYSLLPNGTIDMVSCFPVSFLLSSFQEVLMRKKKMFFLAFLVKFTLYEVFHSLLREVVCLFCSILI